MSVLTGGDTAAVDLLRGLTHEAPDARIAPHAAAVRMHAWFSGPVASREKLWSVLCKK